jgi:hypothetical protein
MTFDVLPAGGKNDHDFADIVCDECKSIIVTLHSPRAQKASARPKRAAKAREMAGQAVDRLIDPSAPDEERQSRKRRLLRDQENSGTFAANASPARQHPVAQRLVICRRAANSIAGAAGEEICTKWHVSNPSLDNHP